MKLSNFLFLFCWVIPFFGFSQNCQIALKGNITDLGNGKPLIDVHVFAQELGNEVISDSNGNFTFLNVCPGSYHLVFSHIGCEAYELFIDLVRDTTLLVQMNHSYHVTKGVKVKGENRGSKVQSQDRLSEQAIADNGIQNLGNMLESISGVSTLKNGSGISKPVVHGLYGNRVTILNNGIAQSGQQWGNDHSPEIDPLVANHITVVKGVSALEYMGSNLGSVILVQPKKIAREPHLHGKATYYFESNGLSNGVNLQLQQATKFLAWRVNGTIKKSGDKNAPNYFLTNTGTEEVNLAVQFEKALSKKWFSDIYISTFNTNLGVLRGSHIGNVSDLNEAFVRDEPFFTNEDFSYAINAPMQKVSHQFIKLHNKYYLNDSAWLNVTYAFQYNNRKEFDVRRSGRTETPALSLAQQSHFFEVKYHNDFNKTASLDFGLQSNYVTNINDPETRILPLIPDYISSEQGTFLIFQKSIKKSLFEAGVRYDRVGQNVVTISQSLPRSLVRYANTFDNFGASLSWDYPLFKSMALSSSIGLATRNPAINELYSGGLHQGVSGLELGNTGLSSEQSTKATLGLAGALNEKWSVEALAYYQQIQNYIFLKPQNQFSLTIRGAFPIFAYEQTDAQIYGGDISVNYAISQPLSVKVRYSYIKGDDLTNQIPLIFMPANNGVAAIAYEIPGHIKVGKSELENTTFQLSNRYVFKQSNLRVNQDFLPAPGAYSLLNFQASTDIQWNKTRLRLFLNADNLLNTVYRDYLNRQRYFADDLGLNIRFGGSLKF